MTPTIATRQTVTIIGPDLHDLTFHVHAAGCPVVARIARRRLRRLLWDLEATSLEDVAAQVYADILAENEGATARDYLSEFYFAPCVALSDEAPPTLADADRAEIVERCIDALSDIIIEQHAEQGFGPEISATAEDAIYADVAQRIAPPAHNDASELMTSTWDDHGADTIYLPRNVADRLLERQGWIIEPVHGGDAYVMPGRTPRSKGGEHGTDYVFDRQEAITRALVAEALR